MSEVPFNPYIENAGKLETAEVDRHVATTPIVYYGEMPEGTTAEARLNFPAIEVEDDSGKTNFSVLISGDLDAAKRILVKPMSWSEHPGRGFEALRENLVADSEKGIVTVGISFPGAGLESQKMTHNQWRSLNKRGGDFSYISEQQWQAITQAMKSELTRLHSSKRLEDFEFVLGGSSQGASNTVGLVQSLPEGIHVAGVGLAESVGLEQHPRITGYGELFVKFIQNSSKNFGRYTEVNPYNEYPALGPGHNTAKNILTRPASHVGAVIGTMGRGGDINRLLVAMKEKEIQDAIVMLTAAEHDRMGSPEAAFKAAEAFAIGGLAVREPVIWAGHYHPVMENLANAREALRSFAAVDLTPSNR